MPVKKVLFSFDGRLTRSDFWLKGLLLLLPLSIGAGLLRLMTAGTTLSWLSYLGVLIYVLLIWPSLAVMVKRLHDRGHSGWYLLLELTAFIGLIFVWNLALFIIATLLGSVFPLIIFIETWFMRGTYGHNDYGPDPLLEGRAASGGVSVEGA
jgi:uncharacterized membrane protein YhaH (DUF805 family)